MARKIKIFELRPVYVFTAETVTDAAKFINRDRANTHRMLRDKGKKEKKFLVEYAEPEPSSLKEKYKRKKK
jgi:hypothetical protein